MNTHDPDRCEAARDLQRNGARAVVQCQGSVHHAGRHYFGEDHYTVTWIEASDVSAG
jgi:hypothetical protein